MPNLLLGSGSSFDKYKLILSRWLRSNLLAVSTLTKDCLQIYGNRNFTAGWSIKTIHEGEEITFHVLIDAQFPYSAIKLAYKTNDVYFKWPHVDEKNGLLCLPKNVAPIKNIKEVIHLLICDALELIEHCKSSDFLLHEFRREFLSYWERADNLNNGVVPVRSLLNLKNKNPRAIFLWRGKKFTLVGESKEQVLNWLKNFGRKEDSKIGRGVFGFLNEALAPPFIKNSKELLSLLKNCSPGIDKILSTCSEKNETTIVLAATSLSGDGLISVELSVPNIPKRKGFRKKLILPLSAKKQMWMHYSDLKRTNVERFDSSWVHGRGLDVKHDSLYQANVLILGCGSLGSQVALRLAQSGVGTLILVDPQLLVAANVGRHALGIDSVGRSKAVNLAEEIKTRFPHIRRVEGYHRTWQKHFTEKQDFESNITLIVSCLGEWAADGQLGEWYYRTQPSIPIIYSWLDEHGTASHGVALDNSSPHLGCILGEDGDLRIPETLWNSYREIYTEPACGTFFQPYGPLDVAKAEILTTRLCIDVITKDVQIPCHRVYAGSTADIHSVGGRWSAEHLKYRPEKYEGPFEYARKISYCGICDACRASK